jgi:hypothetical protein
MSEAEFTAMSASDKAMRVHEHYGEALAVDANGQLLSRYENGIWKVFRRPILPAMWPDCSSACAPRSRRGKLPRWWRP